jgi:hypothetical protein
MVQYGKWFTINQIKKSALISFWTSEIRISSKFFDQFVQIHFEDEDYGPATKFLPIIPYM